MVHRSGGHRGPAGLGRRGRPGRHAAAGRHHPGGNLANQRYSPLTRINAENVARQRAVWRNSLKSGLPPRAGNQAQPIVHNGVIYIMTGENDAFAV